MIVDNDDDDGGGDVNVFYLFMQSIHRRRCQDRFWLLENAHHHRHRCSLYSLFSSVFVRIIRKWLVFSPSLACGVCVRAAGAATGRSRVARQISPSLAPEFHRP